MGKSLHGKESGKGISQRNGGLYPARFVNRFGKREAIYVKTLHEIRHQLRTEQYEDERTLNVIHPIVSKLTSNDAKLSGMARSQRAK